MSRRHIANAANFAAIIEDVAGERIGLSQSPVRRPIMLCRSLGDVRRTVALLDRHKIGPWAVCFRRKNGRPMAAPTPRSSSPPSAIFAKCRNARC